MKTFYLAAILLLSGNLFAQTNMSLLGHLPIADQVSSVWGYAAGGHEYALIGTIGGTLLADVTNPADPQPLQYINGQPTPYWREIKIWQHYAYVVSESGGGVQIFDLSTLPGLVQVVNWQTADWQDSTLQITKAHTLWIDENGILYLNGTNLNAVVMADLNVDPLNPTIVGLYTDGYVHDLYVRNDTMWTAQIYDGYFAVVDVSDKANPVVLATQATPNDFTHNTWLSDNGQYLFTTDEKTGAYVTAYDVSDLSDIHETDRYRTSDSGVIPHNTHVLGNFLLTSYYRDGVTIVDASNPNNLVEVGKYDTSPLSGNGFNGVWEVYPYLPSGNLLAGDMEEGLFILHADYLPACYLGGTVTDQNTGQALVGVNISIEGFDTYSTQTEFGGVYSTGIPTSGTYNVTYFLYGYEPFTLPIAFNNGATTDIAISLVPIAPFYASIQVNDTNGQPIGDAQITFYSDQYTYDAITDLNGTASVQLYYGGNYSTAAGKWSYHTAQVSDINIAPDAPNIVQLVLDNGYYDDFLFDFGWETTGIEPQGNFVRDLPIGHTFLGDTIQTYQDVSNDFGSKCYVTGNADLVGDNVNGIKTLISPVFDATQLSDPLLSYYRWTYFQDNNSTGQAANDTLFIRINNGTQTVTLDTITNGDGFESQWHRHKHRIANFITPTDQMRLLVEVSDLGFAPHIVDAAFDYFKVIENVSPVANFSVNQTTSCGATVFEFSDQSTGDIELWQWTITAPNDAEFTSTKQNPNFILNEVGTYIVSLAVFGIAGFDQHIETAYITIYPEAEPLDFADFITTICEGETASIAWMSAATPPPVYTWSGDYVINNGSNFVVAAPPVGQHLYSVTATDANGCIATNAVTITVNELPELPQVSITGNLCLNENPILSVANPQNEVNYNWSIGGLSGTGVVFQIDELTAVGDLPYTLQAISNDNCMSSITDTLSIAPLPALSVNSDLPNLLCPDSIYTIQINALVNTGIPPYTYTWNSNYAEILSFDADSGTLLAQVNTVGMLPETSIFYVFNLSDANGCSVAYTGGGSVVSCIIGIEEITTTELIALSPNPATDILHVNVLFGDAPWNAAGNQPIEMYIYNALGQVVWSKKATGNGKGIAENISVANLTAGIYRFECQDNTKRVGQNFVIGY